MILPRHSVGSVDAGGGGRSHLLFAAGAVLMGRPGGSARLWYDCRPVRSVGQFQVAIAAEPEATLRRTESILAGKARVAVDYLPIYNLGLFCGAQPPVTDLRIQAQSSVSPPHKLTLAIPELEYHVSVILSTESGGGLRPLRGAASLDRTAERRLERLTGATKAALIVSLDEAECFRCPVTLTESGYWPHVLEARASVAAHVLSGHRTIRRAVSNSIPAPRDGMPPDGARGTESELRSLYQWIADSTTIDYEAPRAQHDGWSGTSWQLIQHPDQVLPDVEGARAFANCLDLTLLLAGCLESSGHSPLVIFSGSTDAPPEHAYLGCWTDSTVRFHPVIHDGSDLRRALDDGSLLVLESTGLCHGDHHLSFTEALEAGAAHLRDGPVHAVDIAACRREPNPVRPLVLTQEPLVQEVFWLAQQLGRTRGARALEAVHVLHGLCTAGGEHTRWLISRCRGELTEIAELIEKSLPATGEFHGRQIETRNYEACWRDSLHNARAAGADRVREIDLIWAIVENPSRNIRKVLEAAGVSPRILAGELRKQYGLPGNESISRNVAGASLPSDTDS